MSETSRFIGPLIQFLFPEMPYESRQVIHGIIRKSAHFFEYAVLAFLAVRALSRSHFDVLRNYRYVIAFLITATVASVDEYNQSLNPARTGSIYDVLLDVSGGVFALIMFWVVTSDRERRRA